MSQVKFKFQYGADQRYTVTVIADETEHAGLKARAELDRRYKKAGKEPPVGWTLRLLEVIRYYKVTH